MFQKVFAQAAVPKDLGKLGGPGLGPFANIIYAAQDGAKALGSITKIVSTILGVMTIAAGLWFLFQTLVGGLSWITSAGDEKKTELARHRINDALVGLVVVVAAWSILAIVSTVLGVDFLLANPGEIIQKLSPGP